MSYEYLVRTFYQLTSDEKIHIGQKFWSLA